MATTLTAHREERRLLGIDFTEDLPAGETIASVDYVKVYDAAGSEKTDEVRGPSPTAPSIAGAVVSFWKEVATSATEQPTGTYKVKCRVTLSNAEKPIALGEANKLIHLHIVED